MAFIFKEILIKASPREVWNAIRDVGAIHSRLMPGVVFGAQIEDGARMVKFMNGMVVRELIVDISDEFWRLSYAAVGGNAIHHNASLQVYAEGDSEARVVWMIDVLPHELSDSIKSLVELGASNMKCTLEVASRPSTMDL